MTKRGFYIAAIVVLLASAGAWIYRELLPGEQAAAPQPRKPPGRRNCAFLPVRRN